MTNVPEAATGIRKTKYPLLLVPGAIIRKFLFLRPFGRIDRELRRMGYDARVAQVDGVGTIENNAAMLKEQIDEIVRIDGCEKVNLIGYSKGGLDARYLIEALGCAQ
ncbi:MAG: triacylglycerol lipase, partial [Clostridia bacterium]|nr:triacylglycerol lipase [Clostridia bacterium]